MSIQLQEIGHTVYSRRQFRPGTLILKSRLRAVQNCNVVIIGFVSPSKKKNDVDSYVSGLALTNYRNRKPLIPVCVSNDSVIPEELRAIQLVPYGASDLQASSISATINSVKYENDTQNKSNTGHTKTSKAGCSTSQQKIKWKQCKKSTHEQENQVPKPKKVCIIQEEGRRVMQPIQPSIADRVTRVSESSNIEYFRDGQIKRDSYQRTYDTHTGS
ncbi:uncharacterized protein [Antedon mediterranea]|uniref:uncharacterized protein n=1 Tax=Antedon mediterranea TaxID=105859 RepID=UPI003AF76065